MSNLELNTDVANEPREEITDADLAVGLAEHGFHVYLDDTDRQLTFETVYNYLDDYGQLKDGHTFTVPMMEVAQYGALEALCEKLESFNDVVRTDGGLHADSGLPGLSLEDYADELLDDEESQFVWRNGQSEWENVRRCILSGETKFLHNFLYDAALDYPSRVADIRDDLNDYETTYFKEKQTNKIFAYAIGNSEPFTVVQLDISTEERKNAVSQALKNVINNFFGERNDMSQPYKNLLEQIKPDTEFIHASEGHLSSLKYALRNAESNKELCISMLDSIKDAEKNPEKTVAIKGYSCLQKDAWEERGIKFTIGQSVDDMSFYYARATDGTVTRDYEYDHKPDREKVMSDHADKLAEEDIDRGEAIYGADGYSAFTNPEVNIDDFFNGQESKKSRTENKQALYSIEQGGDVRFYKAPDSYTEEDILKIAYGDKPYAKLMDLGERIYDEGDYAAIQQSEKFAFSVEINFDTDTAQIYKVNDGKGGVSEEDRDGYNIELFDIKISEEREKMQSLSKTKAENILQKLSISNSLKNADPSATRGESRGNAMEQNRQVLYSMEREGEMYFFKAPKECSVEDIMKNASFDTLMKLGEQIDKATFSAIDQSEQLTFSVEMNFDTDRALICKVNDGRGGLTLADRNDLDFPGEDVYEVQISREREILREKEYSQSLSETKAAPSAIRTERQNTMSNTKMECTGMVTFAEGNAKAVAQITINNEFAIKGIKVYEGEKGLFVSMPSRKIGSEYQDVVFPITAEARAQLNNAVLETYGKLVESGLEKLPIEKKAPPEKSTSKISVSLHMLDDEKTKAVGQIVIDGSIVVSGVKVRHGTNAQGEEKDFVSMPSYQTQTGEYKEYALPVTKDCYDEVNKAVFGAYETLQKTEYKGVNLSELGTKGEVSSKYGMNNAFAAKLMAELDKQNIPYSARVAPDATTLSVKNADRAAVDKVQKALAEALTAEKKAAQNQQPEQQTQSKPKKTR